MAKDRIPTLAGIKFTNSDLMSYQYCLRADDGAWDVPFGFDEHMLGALAMGAHPYRVAQLHWHNTEYRPLLEKMGIDWEQAWAEFQESLKKLESGEVVDPTFLFVYAPTSLSASSKRTRGG